MSGEYIHGQRQPKDTSVMSGISPENTNNTETNKTLLWREKVGFVKLRGIATCKVASHKCSVHNNILFKSVNGSIFLIILSI